MPMKIWKDWKAELDIPYCFMFKCSEIKVCLETVLYVFVWPCYRFQRDTIVESKVHTKKSNGSLEVQKFRKSNRIDLKTVRRHVNFTMEKFLL